MQEINVHLNNEHSVGLGDNLCLISALANAQDKVVLHVSNEHNTLNRLKQYARIFRIPLSKLSIEETDSNGNFNNTGWPVKLLTEYYRPSYVNVNGQILPTYNNNNKRCIAIAGFYADKPDNNKNEWPWCKHRPVEYWAKIFAWAKSLDYEVITIDRPGFDLENKIELMVKHCRAVISYEGGMAHLAHMLGIPCFLIDWTFPTESTTLDHFHCDFVHMSKSVYIVRDDEEILNWNNTDFNRTVDKLKDGRTNNRFLSGSHRFEFADRIYGDVTVYDRSGQSVLTAPPMFGDSLAAEFVARNYYQKWERSQRQQFGYQVNQN